MNHNSRPKIGAWLWRMTHKLAERRSSRTAYQIAIVEPLVDERYYFERYPHLRQSGMSAAEHYVVEGWRFGYDPAPWFSSQGYTQINADVAKERTPPLVHYAMHGRREGRTISPTEDVRLREQPPEFGSGAVAQVSADLRMLRAREEHNWPAHIIRYTERRLAHLGADGADQPPHPPAPAGKANAREP